MATKRYRMMAHVDVSDEQTEQSVACMRIYGHITPDENSDMLVIGTAAREWATQKANEAKLMYEWSREARMKADLVSVEVFEERTEEQN